MSLTPARILVVMGVASSGKTVTGKAIARHLHAPFLDGDDFHPAANKDKMRASIALTDADRWPWLGALAEGLRKAAEQKGVAVGACSALKRSYRDYLIAKAGEPILFVFLDGTIDTIRRRIETRRHEFMSPALLDSQFATLEPPSPPENVVRVDVTDAVETIAAQVVRQTPHLKVFKRKQ